MTDIFNMHSHTLRCLRVVRVATEVVIDVLVGGEQVVVRASDVYPTRGTLLDDGGSATHVHVVGVSIRALVPPASEDPDRHGRYILGHGRQIVFTRVQSLISIAYA